jgi:hypothetical protein
VGGGADRQSGTDGGFWLVALRAIYVLLIWLTTAPISALGFGHSVAGSVEAFYRAFEHTAGWREMAGNFVLPLLNHGQVAADRAGDG